MKTQYDVCVVGGGAAGMAAAIAAAEGGNTVCIIDKNKNWARNYMPQAMVDAIWQIQI